MNVVRKLFLTLFFAALPVYALAFGNMPAGGGTPPGSVPLAGKVVETHSSGGYTYICLEKDGKQVWAAIPESPVERGREISLKPGMEMKNFASKGLNRTFESIYFSEGLAVQTASTEGKSSHGSQGGVVTPSEKIAVAKAAGPNAYTVTEIHQQKGKLDGKTVAVRGKVTKVSSGIMGKNWIHLQDGSGDAKKGTHDLTVTSQDLPATGDVVTASGTVRKDKDFGGGYKYSVVIEDGAIKH
ncbi:MAG: DNA-binding protein [Desulfuromonadales bacterium]|nr:MAG: DNA-binding protein [Desulfuromonadales bacterium]